MKYNSKSMIAKRYLKGIYCKSKLENLFSSVLLNNAEYEVIYMYFIDYMTIYMISSKLALSESTVKRYLKTSLNKIYKYLEETNLI